MQSKAKPVAARRGRSIAMFCFLAAVSCGGQTSSGAASTAVESGDSGTGGTTTASGAGGRAGASGRAGSGGILFGGTGGAAAGTGGDAADASLHVLDAGPPPTVLCGPGRDGSADISDGSTCAPPPSHCADNRTLVYYTGGRCADGRCVWTVQRLACRIACSDGGCQNNFTLTR